MTDWFAPAYWVGGNPYAASDASYAANVAAQQANQAAVNQASFSAAAPTGSNSIYQSAGSGPGGITTPGYGMVQPYPSFGEASGGSALSNMWSNLASTYAPEQAFSPSGGTGGYTPSYSPPTDYSSYVPEPAFSPSGWGGYSGYTPYQPDEGYSGPSSYYSPPAYSPPAYTPQPDYSSYASYVPEPAFSPAAGTAAARWMK